jgi:hypothetical protein
MEQLLARQVHKSEAVVHHVRGDSEKNDPNGTVDRRAQW